MNPRIASIENLIAQDPGGRNIFGLLIADQLRLAAQSLRLAKRVGIVSGFYVPAAGAGETDGPPGAKLLGQALIQLGIEVDYLTDEWNAPLFRALGLEPITDVAHYLVRAEPTHLLSIERAGRTAQGQYCNMRGEDITAHTAPLDELFLQAGRLGLTTIGIGDGGNEIGMGRVFSHMLDTDDPGNGIDHGRDIATVVSTDFCLVAGVSNWGAYGLTGALSILTGKPLLPTAEEAARDLEQVVTDGGAVDGRTHRSEPTVDGLAVTHSIRVLEDIRRQTVHSPLENEGPLLAGVLGYGESGRAATRLLTKLGHRVVISDREAITLDRGVMVAGVETGGHTLDALGDCDLVVASPGVRPDAPIRNALHRRGIPVMSELELASQLCRRPIIAVTGTIGKRSTVELLQALFDRAGSSLTIGGNRGKPLSAILTEDESVESESHADPIALAVSSFQLETVVHFRPHIAILLNIDEAHLDRHRSVAEYVRIKSRLFMNHHPDDVLILNYDDPRVRPLARKHQGRTFFVSASQAVDRGAWLADGQAWLNVHGAVESVGPIAPQFAEDLLSSLVVARLYGLEIDTLVKSVSALQPDDVTR